MECVDNNSEGKNPFYGIFIQGLENGDLAHRIQFGRYLRIMVSNEYEKTLLSLCRRWSLGYWNTNWCVNWKHSCLFLRTKPLQKQLHTCLNHQVTIWGKDNTKQINSFFLNSRPLLFLLEGVRIHTIFIAYFYKLFWVGISFSYFLHDTISFFVPFSF